MISDETTRKPLGELLKQGRLRQKLSIVECAKRTHIAARFIEAIEAERWSDLPSESHRQGFLLAYCRFLGVAPEAALGQYQKERESAHAAPVDAGQEAIPAKKPAKGNAVSAPHSWFTGSWEQLAGILIVLLIGAWGIYHLVGRTENGEIRPNLWMRPRAQQARLITPKPVQRIQKIRLHSVADSYVRVTERRHLLYEGVFPAGATKAWTGEGPFLMRLSDPHAVEIFWNDQPVDANAPAHNGAVDFQLPLSKVPESPPAQ